MSNTYTTKKALKIATALYMITDIMSEKEPLKWHLRTCAVSLLEADVRSMRSVVERTLDILTISRIARAVSAMNADVLEDELKMLLITVLDESGESETIVPLFGKEFFTVNAELEAPAVKDTSTTKDAVKDSSTNETQIKSAPLIDTRPKVAVTESKPISNVITHVEKREDIRQERQPERPVTTLIPQGIRSAFMPRVTLIDTEIAERQGRSDDTRSSRRDVIINVIREKENCSIKDIANKLPNVSEKTIQRELVAMTEEGILAKQGDRRWSTYSIATGTAKSV